jgi:transcriptional regulator with XRE-family HTH domain
MDKTPQELTAEEVGLTRMGQRLLELRLAKGWRQEDLAEASDTSIATIRAIENHSNGRRYLDNTMQKLSMALGEEGDYLDRYQREHRDVESGSQPEAVRAQPPRPPGRRTSVRIDELMPQLDQVVVSRLNELVVPRLENMERQVHLIVDAFHPSQRIEVDNQHPGDAK